MHVFAFKIFISTHYGVNKIDKCSICVIDDCDVRRLALSFPHNELTQY